MSFTHMSTHWASTMSTTGVTETSMSRSIGQLGKTILSLMVKCPYIKSNSLTPFKILRYLTSTKSTSIRSTFIYTHIHLYFQKQDTNNPNTPYDNSSVMHYPIWISSFVRHDGTLFKSQLPTVLILLFSHKMCPSSILGPAFSIENGKDTITPIPNLSVKIGC